MDLDASFPVISAKGKTAPILIVSAVIAVFTEIKEKRRLITKTLDIKTIIFFIINKPSW
jgi:hypothetical protein